MMSTSIEGFHGLLRPAANLYSDTGYGVSVARDAQRGESLLLHGDVCNLQSLGRELGTVPGTAPAAVLLTGWRRWSQDLLHRLNGVFSFVLHLPGRLVLYRDPSGLKNLYAWTGRPGEVAFATHPVALSERIGAPLRIRIDSVHEFLRFLDIASPNTIFEDVVAIEPGKAMSWTAAEGLAPVPTASHAPETQQFESFAAALDGVDERLRRSVALRLDGSTHPAAFLSGGVDSALLCALSAQLRPDIKALTVGFIGTRHDESGAARRIAGHLGLKHEVLSFDRAQVLAALDRLVSGMHQPMGDPSTPVTLLAFDHARRDHDTVLDGTGADEAVGMMPPRHLRLAIGQASRLPQPVRQCVMQTMRRFRALAPYAPIFDFEHPADLMIRWKGFTRPEIAALTGRPVSFAHTHFFETFTRFPRGAHFDRYSALLDAMPCERLNQSMVVSGLAPQFPFCDIDVDRYLRHLPVDHRYRPGQPKRILRSLLARHVPRPLWDSPKHGFDFPLPDFLAGDNYSLVRRHLDADRWRAQRLLDPDLVRQYADRFIAGENSLAFRVWSLVILGAWLENHGSCVSMPP